MDNRLKRIILTPFNLLYRISPELTLKMLFRLKRGEKLHLNNPKTYNEKLQWLKLNDKNPLLPCCCDKYTVRSYLEEKGCAEILNDLYWCGKRPEDIPFDALPEQFVIKVTHGSAFNIICKNKSALNRSKTIHTLRCWLTEKYLPCYGEWFYGQVEPSVIVERYLEDDGEDGLMDYKVYCFHGEPRMVSVDHGRFTGQHFKDIYTLDWNLRRDYRMASPCSNIPMPKPGCLDEILQYSRILSEDFMHVRVDFYIIENRPVFGELTFINGAGFNPICPREFELEMGNWLKAP